MEGEKGVFGSRIWHSKALLKGRQHHITLPLVQSVERADFGRRE